MSVIPRAAYRLRQMVIPAASGRRGGRASETGRRHEAHGRRAPGCAAETLPRRLVPGISSPSCFRAILMQNATKHLVQPDRPDIIRIQDAARSLHELPRARIRRARRRDLGLRSSGSRRCLIGVLSQRASLPLTGGLLRQHLAMPGTSENGIKNLAELRCRLRGGFMNPSHEQRPPGVREGNQHERNACRYGGLEPPRSER
jgi:hypothetical protein